MIDWQTGREFDEWMNGPMELMDLWRNLMRRSSQSLQVGSSLYKTGPGICMSIKHYASNGIKFSYSLKRSGRRNSDVYSIVRSESSKLSDKRKYFLSR